MTRSDFEISTHISFRPVDDPTEANVSLDTDGAAPNIVLLAVIAQLTLLVKEATFTNDELAEALRVVHATLVPYAPSLVPHEIAKPFQTRPV
ncbi:MAG: hypothetical protein DI640_12960 [Sphingomonas taxi]|uniref:Uncharacterized protein n=1 Tax=Sphingomonas taxi TaxID=1549858 RepID=A0A2W4YXP2_9SPHN|nr:MAG: hypothetical protein DI640_12960 [Sphingomonas taxi]